MIKIFTGFYFIVCALWWQLSLSTVAVAATVSPKILTSIRPLGLLAETVVGERGHVDVLLPNTASAHHYALKVSDRQRLNSADIVLWVGGGLEAFLQKPLIQRQGITIAAIELSNIQWPYKQDSNYKDPHLWLNPQNNQVIVDALIDQLIQVSPRNSAYYRRNGEQLKQRLEQLDKKLMVMMRPLQTQAFIVAHPAYDHFVGRYGLRQLGYVSLIPEHGLGAKHLYQLRQQKNARCLFTEEGMSGKQVELLSRDLDIPLLSLDPLGIKARNVEDMIWQIGLGFQRCLGGGV